MIVQSCLMFVKVVYLILSLMVSRLLLALLILLMFVVPVELSTTSMA
jgi:hypothetical protein